MHARPLILLVALAAPTLATADDVVLPDSKLGQQVAPILLLSRPDIRAALKLTDAQAGAARSTLATLRAQAEDLKGQAGPVAAATRRSLVQAQRRWIDAQLDPAQRGRLAQLDLQWEGPSALVTRPAVATALGLAEPQRQALATAVGRRDELRARGRLKQEDERRLAAEAIETLSADQQREWRQMLGEPFAFQVAAVGAVTR